MDPTPPNSSSFCALSTSPPQPAPPPFLLPLPSPSTTSSPRPPPAASPGERMSSSDEKEPDQPRRACQACKRQRRRCGPWCKFAPYFPPDDDPARYEAVHRIFGRYNVEKLLAQVPPEKWKGAVESIVYEATARARNPRYGCVYDIIVLENLLQRIRDELAATRGAIAVYAGPEVAFLPFDPADATPEVTELADAVTNATLESATAEDDRQRALRQDKGKGKAVDDAWEEDDDLEALRLVAGAQNSAAAARAAKEQEMIMAIMRQDAAAQSYAGMMQPGAAEEVAREQGMMARLPVTAPRHAGMGLDDVTTGPGHPITNQEALLQMARAQQAAPALGLDVTLEHDQPHQDQQIMMLQMAGIQQLDAVAERAREQNMMMQHAAAVPQYDHDLAQYAAAMGLNVSPGNARQLPLLQTALPMAQAPQDMLTMPQHPAAAQQQLQQLTATGLDLSLGHGHSTHPHQQTVRMQQAAAVVGAAPGSSSGGTVVAFQPLGTADADPFLVQQQPQDDALGLQMDPALPPLPTALGQQGNDQVPNQQDMDGGDGDLASALRPFFG
ncbi:hypothetical protein ACP70R_015302 [Stipagrostis hirtigluma subsp. patula]